MKQMHLTKLLLFAWVCISFCLSALYSQDNPGHVYLVPSTDYITLNTTFYTELRANTGTDKLGAYGVEIFYDPIVVNPDLLAGDNGFDLDVNNFTNVVNSKEEGRLFLSGFSIHGAEPGTDVHIINIYWRTTGLGPAAFTMNVKTFSSTVPTVIGTPAGFPLDLVVNNMLLGDVDGSSSVDILDALMTARHYVGEESGTFNPLAADVNSDGVIDIIDALMIARYYVGLLPEFPGTVPTPAPAPTPFPEPVTITVKLFVEGDNFQPYIILSAETAGISLMTISGSDGAEKSFQVAVPGVVNLTPSPSSAFQSWGGDLVTTEMFPRLYIDSSIYIEAYFDKSSLPTSPPTAFPTPAPTPRPTPVPTPGPVTGAGSVWLSPASITAGINESFTTTLYVNSGNQQLAAYGFDCIFDTALLAVDSTIGTNGVETGPDGFISAVNDTNPGLLSIAGFDTEGAGPGTALEILRIHWITLDTVGATEIGLVVNDLNDQDINAINTPGGSGSGITISDSPRTLLIGDVNGDGNINIIDALVTSQYSSGLNPASFQAGGSDVNADGVINIIDALMIAQYCVGLISHF